MTDSVDSDKPLSASRWLRLANCVIDCIGLMAFFSVVGLVAGLVGAPNPAKALQKIHPFLLGSISIVAYYTLLEGLFGRTLGKLVTGTRVVDASGGRPQFRQVLGRSFSRLIPLEPLSIFFDHKDRAWHDSLPETYVVKV